MDAPGFDSLARAFSAGSSRRAVGAVVAALGLATTLPDQTRAGQRRKPRPNEYGCLDVGKKCRGKDSKCCSGICHGKKPRHGERDKSRCAGHHEGTCRDDQQRPECGGAADVRCTNAAGQTGLCAVTTGKAAYCLRDFDCFPCRGDTDCEPYCGAGAACIACAGSCASQGGTACAGIDDCVFPGTG